MSRATKKDNLVRRRIRRKGQKLRDQEQNNDAQESNWEPRQARPYEPLRLHLTSLCLRPYRVGQITSLETWQIWPDNFSLHESKQALTDDSMSLQIHEKLV
jgi:hypothetical protein